MLTNINDKIAELNKKVNSFSSNNSKINSGNNFSKIYKSKFLLYFIAPILLLIIFITTKPSFVSKKYLLENNKIAIKLDFTKIFMIVIVISLIINFFIYKKIITK
tara:strand:+ start:23 stop:337 length:315 start_codon:yes stop_codon:yes gene_type:complete